MPYWQSPQSQWLCCNSCTWAHDVRLHKAHDIRHIIYSCTPYTKAHDINHVPKYYELPQSRCGDNWGDTLFS